MTTFGLISHSHKQLTVSAAKGRDLWTSRYFELKRAYVENAKIPWAVMSPARGICFPDDMVASYNWKEFAFDETSMHWRTGMQRVLDSNPDLEKIILLGGAHYEELVKQVLSELQTARPVALEAPTKGMPIGKKLQYLKRAQYEYVPSI